MYQLIFLCFAAWLLYSKTVKCLSEYLADIESQLQGHETEANQQDMNLQMVKIFIMITLHVTYPHNDNMQ